MTVACNWAQINFCVLGIRNEDSDQTASAIFSFCSSACQMHFEAISVFPAGKSSELPKKNATQRFSPKNAASVQKSSRYAICE